MLLTLSFLQIHTFIESSIVVVDIVAEREKENWKLVNREQNLLEGKENDVTIMFRDVKFYCSNSKCIHDQQIQLFVWKYDF